MDAVSQIVIGGGTLVVFHPIAYAKVLIQVSKPCRRATEGPSLNYCRTSLIRNGSVEAHVQLQQTFVNRIWLGI